MHSNISETFKPILHDLLFGVLAGQEHLLHYEVPLVLYLEVGCHIRDALAKGFDRQKSGFRIAKIIGDVRCQGQDYIVFHLICKRAGLNFFTNHAQTG